MGLGTSATDDLLLWTRFRQGDDVALGQLMQRHFSGLYQYGCSFCQKPELVDDTIQELFLDLWQRRATLSDVNYVRTYLLAALRNRLLDVLRRPNRMILRDTWTDGDLGFEGVFVIENQLLEEEQQQTILLQHLLRKLTKRQREAIYLRFYQNLDNEAIAALMQITRPAAANLISTALIQLRKHWGSIIPLIINILYPILWNSPIIFIIK